MKVLLVNGSPRPKGCTFTALREVEKTLNENAIETELFQIGAGPVYGCTGCRACRATGVCVIDQDPAILLSQKMMDADGIVIGSPVYFAGPNGSLCALLDRAFYMRGKPPFRGKPAAAVISCRRAGSTAAYDRLNKYFGVNEMYIVGSQYWNMVHGNTPEEVLQDLEGLQTMRTLGLNMAHILKSFAAASLPLPEAENKLMTNFIR